MQDKIRFSKGLLRGATPPDYAKTLSEQLAANLDSAAARIGAAGRAFSQADSSGSGRALDHARDLVQGLESLRERMEAQKDGQTGGRTDGQQRQPGGQQQGGQQQGGQACRAGQDSTPGSPMQGENSGGGHPGYAPRRRRTAVAARAAERRADAEALGVNWSGCSSTPPSSIA